MLLQSIILKFQPQQELENIFLSTSLETKRNSLIISWAQNNAVQLFKFFKLLLTSTCGPKTVLCFYDSYIFNSFLLESVELTWQPSICAEKYVKYE